MLKKTILSVVVSGLCLVGTDLSALSLKEGVQEVLGSNPVVQERLSNFKSTQQDLDIAKSEWLPSLDYRASIGRSNGGDLFKSDKNFKHAAQDTSYTNYTNSLKLTQNIFNGFSTTSKIDYQEARILAAANHYVENVNDIAFKTTGAYIDVIRSYQLLQNAKDAVAINQKIYEDVKSIYDQGLTTKSEMTKIYAALALAKSNLVVQENNTMDREFKLRRLLGRDVSITELSLPALDIQMPSDIDEASKIAIENNPSLIVSHYNTKAAEALYRQKKSKYYPTVNIEAEQMLDNYGDDTSNHSRAYESADDRQRIMLVLNWNLFNGFADKADVQKSRSEINKEVELHKDLKRQTIEGLSLSWSAYSKLGDQLKDLYEYYKYSQDTLDSYKSEYEMGRRTLLDLLSAQNDLISSKSQIINAQMDKLYAQYRILDAMGLLVKSVLNEEDYKKAIEPTLKPFDKQLDTLPTKEDTIVYSGARSVVVDSDFDGVADDQDKCPNTLFGLKVDENGCEVKDTPNRYNLTDESYTKMILKPMSPKGVQN